MTTLLMFSAALLGAGFSVQRVLIEARLYPEGRRMLREAESHRCEAEPCDVDLVRSALQDIHAEAIENLCLYVAAAFALTSLMAYEGVRLVAR